MLQPGKILWAIIQEEKPREAQQSPLPEDTVLQVGGGQGRESFEGRVPERR